MSVTMATSLCLDDFDLIQLVTSDMNGIPRGKLIPRDVAKNKLAGLEVPQIIHCCGTACDLPPMSREDNFGNGVTVPDWSSLVGLPSATRPGRRVGQLIIGHLLQEDGQPDPTSPRYCVQQLLTKLDGLGYKLHGYFSCQFFVFKQGENREYLDESQVPVYTGGEGGEGGEGMMLELCRQLLMVGVEVHSWSAGGQGMYEISLAPCEGLTVADMAWRLRLGVRAVLAQHGYHVTFMTRPQGHKPAGTKLTFTLRDVTGRNLFLDRSTPDHFSVVCGQWLAGIIHHGPALTALCRPTVNCYGHDDVTSPRRFDWDVNNVTSFLNVQVAEHEVWVEQQTASSASNPYLLLLATLAAGWDGQNTGLTCPERRSPAAVARPSTLADCLPALQADGVMARAMTSLIHQSFVSVKQHFEVDKFKATETLEATRELENYLYYTRI
ncbi:lengsin-like [Physella acuta]|uniref:lengsin-like n=1 Tax=Physella acuta TaxID=109671 RepID=UPI0027DCC365|nr:lengsin-like [Physella acuta]